MKLYVLHFDGACGPRNPGGLASYGYRIECNGDEVAKGHGTVGYGPEMSNNVAEHAALGHGLKAFIKHYVTTDSEIGLAVKGDSMLVINQMKNVWRTTPNKLYYKWAIENITLRDVIREKGISVSFTWVPREKNSECDELSKINQK